VDDAGRPPLAALGLRPGDRVRFRRGATGHWTEGVVTGRERDGSVGLQEDRKGASRAIAPSRLEVRRPGPRGGLRWIPVAELAASREQLSLFG
jgi:hypothetical protein